MRYVPVNCLREGMILGKTLLGIDGQILLKSGTELHRQYVKRVAKLGVQGLYINDELSEDVEIRDVLSDELRSTTLQYLSTSFKIADGKSQSAPDVERTLQLVSDIVTEILENQTAIVNIIDIKIFDDYTYHHCLNVAILSVVLGHALGYSREKLVKLAYSALLHDMGMVFIDGDVLSKPEFLAEDEMAQVRRHTTEGYLYLKEHYHMAEISARGVLEHHERYDGSGYPRHLQAEKISEFGRVIAVADVYDALISDRPYRRRLFYTEATEYILAGGGTRFDPEVVGVFAKKLTPFPEGTCVMLSNGQNALVVRNYEGYPQRPLVRVFSGDTQPYLLDLHARRDALDITIIATLEM